VPLCSTFTTSGRQPNATRFDVEDLDDYIDINRCRNRKQDGLKNVTLSR
jgi:hypothetical protein